MKQEEKTERAGSVFWNVPSMNSRSRGIGGASVNTICTAGNISKGLLYHYYTDKDTLYLACVEKCYQE